MEFKNYYKILEVDKHVTGEEIAKSYRKFARRYHPDINPGDEEAQARYRQITEAHDVLANPDARAKYDRLSAQWEFQQETNPDEPFNWLEWLAVPESKKQEASFDDLLSKLKAESQNGHSEFYQALFEPIVTGREPLEPQKGEDYNQEIEITLPEAFSGTSRVLRIGERRIEVRIPRGADNGTKIRVRGEGADGIAGGPKGDLYLEIKIAPDSGYQREGDDLHIDLPVNVYSAVLGGEALLPTLKGKIKLRIPPETQSGKVFRIKGQGMPNLKNPDKRGDLYAKVMITVPENLTELEVELFEELADIRGL